VLIVRVRDDTASLGALPLDGTHPGYRAGVGVKLVRSRPAPLRASSATRGSAWRLARVQAPSIPFDLAATVGLALLATAAAFLAMPIALRTILGLPLVLFLPGYALVSAFFPARDGPDGVARIALAVALSLATVPVLGLAIDRSPWPIDTRTVTAGLLTVVVAASLVAALLRSRLPDGDRYAVRLAPMQLPPPRSWSRSTRATVALATVAGLLLVVGGTDVVRTRLAGTPLTEFALYNAAGEVRFYPRQIPVGAPATVQVGVTNHEGHTVAYVLSIAGAGVALDPPVAIRLADGETWTGPVRFTVVAAGDDLRVRFELRRDDRPAADPPYRLLELVVAGAPPPTPTP
jgi:uncharacterized membrane protein